MGLARKHTYDSDDFDIATYVDIEKSDHITRASSHDSSGDEYIPPSPVSSRGEYGSREAMLPQSRTKEARRPSKLSPSYYYRIPNRTMRWLCIALMSTILLFILSLIRMSALSTRHLEQAMKDRPAPPPPWESFSFLRRYYGGIRTLLPAKDNVPEWPKDPEAIPANERAPPPAKDKVPQSKAMNPYPEYHSQEYTSIYGPVQDCYLDENDTVKIPSVHSYTGVTHGYPNPATGSYEILGLSDSVCYDRYGRMGPYGYGYSLAKGGIGAGLDGEREGAENVWKSGQVDYSNVRWGEAQSRCLDKNKHRFSSGPANSHEAFREMPVARAENSTQAAKIPSHASESEKPSLKSQTKKEIPRTAVVIRTWSGFRYTPEAIIYLRSVISELSLLSGGEYTVHFLIHVKDENLPIWSDEATYQDVLDKALPEEFHGMGTLWSVRQMSLIYAGIEETFYRNIPLFSVYRSAHMPLQYFAHKHPEYSYFWNLEMDVRYTGQWYNLLTSLTDFARAQPRKGLWERNGRYYIPSEHGTWDDFKQMVRVQSTIPTSPSPANLFANAGPPDAEAPPTDEAPVWGPLPALDTPTFSSDPIPPSSHDKDKYTWGVGEDADLITLNPMFDPARTLWLLNTDSTGYNTTLGPPPRRAAIITIARMSRKLLDTMHREVALYRHSMFTEMWPASTALHHGLKAVYAPHPMYIDRDWPTPYLARQLNSGLKGATGGARTGIFGADIELQLQGVTWYYNSGFAPNFWKRWLGYRVNGDGGEESELAGEGRMCVPGVLLHPVKEVGLVVESAAEEVVEEVAEEVMERR